MPPNSIDTGPAPKQKPKHASKRLRVMMLCPGLGHVRRGFETGAARYFEALRNYGASADAGQPALDVRLFCGGRYPGARRVRCLQRGGRAAAWLRRLKIIKDGARIEQLSFGLFLLPYLWKMRPDVIWLQEYSLGLWLLKLRSLPVVGAAFNYQIVFCNGAPIGPELYQVFDWIHHLHEAGFEQGVDYGLSPDRMEILPYCCPAPPATTPDERAQLRAQRRAQLGLSEDDWVIVSVAAWNRGHKRIDYLIEEVAALKDERVKLVLCGQPEPETEELKAQAARELGERVLWLTLPAEKIFAMIAMADVFVLASLHEALGVVLIEAALSGVPVVCHPHNGANLVFAGMDEAALRDLSRAGALTERLRELRHSPPGAEQLERVRASVFERFSPQSIGPKLAAMIRDAFQFATSDRH